MRWLAPTLAITLMAGCRPDCTPQTGADAPIVLLVTVDTLRADHVGADGSGSRAQTPALARLAAEGVRFTDAYSAANVTVPSHVSLLSSRPLASHRVISNHATTAGPLDTLPARFAAAGYRTAAFVSALHLGPTMLMGHLLPGLERFEGPSRATEPWRAEETTDRTLAWLRGACRGPAFAWVHLWDPHMPYAPPAPFDHAYYAGDPRDPRNTSMATTQLDWILYDTTRVREQLNHHPRALRTLKRHLGIGNRAARRLILHPDGLLAFPLAPADHTNLIAITRDVDASLRRHLPFNATLAGFLTGVRDVAYPRALYAGEVSYIDREVGRLRATIESWGLANRTVLLVTGDHGEGLGDHGLYFNHIGLWGEMLHVPLIVWAPGRLAPGVREDPASGLDVAPTLLALAGLPGSTAMEGRDLFAPSIGDHPIVAEAARGAQIALRSGPWKLVRTLQSSWVNDAFHPERGQVELYDLVSDPTEHANRVADRPDVAAALGARLDDWMRSHALAPDGTGYATPAAPVAPATAERLRALGYAE